MVLKKGKYGVRTGGTIRSHPNTIKRYDERASDATAKVTFFRPSSAGEDRSSLNLPEHFENGIQYSLNKRDRWNLPAKVYQEVQALAIEDYAAASADDGRKKRSGKHSQQSNRRHSVALVQHPGVDVSNRTMADSESNFVMYYGDRYPIPVERASRKSKLDAMNVVAQLDEGSFFSGRHDHPDDGSSSVSDESSQHHERSHRVIRSVRGTGTTKYLVQQSGPRSAIKETEVEAEHIHVFLADKKYVNKRQVLKQPKKPIEHQLPAGNVSNRAFTRISSDDTEYRYSDDDEESSTHASDHEDEQQIMAPPPAASFNLSNFLVAVA